MHLGTKNYGLWAMENEVMGYEISGMKCVY